MGSFYCYLLYKSNDSGMIIIIRNVPTSLPPSNRKQTPINPSIHPSVIAINPPSMQSRLVLSTSLSPSPPSSPPSRSTHPSPSPHPFRPSVPILPILMTPSLWPVRPPLLTPFLPSLSPPPSPEADAARPRVHQRLFIPADSCGVEPLNDGSNIDGGTAERVLLEDAARMR